ncbi:MAG: hypothetical protein FWE60_01120 [Oscillospiraceae bacterium]|nr:hypothetical protein [Oscillospiraceae bacterium]
MNIQKVHDAGRNSYAHQARPAAQETQKKNTTLAAENTDKIEKDSVTYKSAYSHEAKKTDYANVNRDDFRSKASSSARQLKNEAVRGMVQAQVNGQVNKGGYKPLFGGNQTVLDALKAAEATSEKHTDYWGVEATAERIFTFAKSLAGSDDGMFQTMKDAFLKGFKAAEGARGGRLPSISYQTRDRVLEMFDSWEKEINAKKSGEGATGQTTGSSTSASHSGGKTIPFIGAGKFGAPTPPPTTYSKGEKIPFIGPEKFGPSFKPDGKE